MQRISAPRSVTALTSEPIHRCFSAEVCKQYNNCHNSYYHLYVLKWRLMGVIKEVVTHHSVQC